MMFMMFLVCLFVSAPNVCWPVLLLLIPSLGGINEPFLSSCILYSTQLSLPLLFSSFSYNAQASTPFCWWELDSCGPGGMCRMNNPCNSQAMEMAAGLNFVVPPMPLEVDGPLKLTHGQFLIGEDLGSLGEWAWGDKWLPGDSQSFSNMFSISKPCQKAHLVDPAGPWERCRGLGLGLSYHQRAAPPCGKSRVWDSWNVAFSPVLVVQLLHRWSIPTAHTIPKGILQAVCIISFTCPSECRENFTVISQKEQKRSRRASGMEYSK